MAKQLFKTPSSPIGCSDRASVLHDLKNDFNPQRNVEAVGTVNTFLSSN